jgi:signal transduction histidine kinase
MTLEAPQVLASAAADGALGDVLREYMQVAQRLQQTHGALQREVVRLRRELESKDRELELRRRLAALGELAAGVAHEVRNPLGAIQLYSGLLRDECRVRQFGPGLELIGKIEAGIQAIDAVIQDTLALAPRNGPLGVCDLRQVVARARDAALPVYTGQGVALECEAGLRTADGREDDVRVRADEAGLQRVIVNLLVNAAEASPPGGVVRVEVVRSSTSHSGAIAHYEAGADPPAALGAGALIELRVSDEGPGLPDEIRHRIFEPFFTTKPRGTGLGLTIAHRLIEAYGGRLSAANRPAGGAVFTVSLPQATAQDHEEEHKAGARQFSAA